LTDELPEAVAVACFEFVFSALSENPYLVGKRLREPLSDLFAARRGEFRVVYSVVEKQILVQVVTIRHRRDVYRS
jgi:mRNA-degrading endonuclease RelE of RelBE toxin-antitoxin system